MIVIGRKNACESHAFGILYIFDFYSTLIYFYDLPFPSGWRTHGKNQKGACRKTIH